MITVVQLTACQAWNKIHQAYEGQFYPSQVELEYETGMDKAEERAAVLFAQVDQKLHRLLQELELQEDWPPDNWAENLQEAHPWLTGVQVMDSQGEVQQGAQDQDLPWDRQQILQLHDNWQDQNIEFAVFPRGNSTWMTLIRPCTQGKEWQGLLLAFFRMESLFSNSSQPQDMLLLSRQKVLWPGAYPSRAQELLDTGFTKRLQHQSHGEVEVSGLDFYWTARYVGSEPVLYLIAK